jgi:hypothetical protein
MNTNIRRLAEESGFEFWGDEEWRPHGAVIDWAAQYDQEFARFVQALVRETVRIEREGTDALAYFDIEPTHLESVELELSDEEFARYARFAHNNDITFNRVVENALRDFILQHERQQQCASE